MEKILFGVSLVIFAVSVGVAVYVRRSLVRYTTLLMESFDAVLSGKTDVDFSENQDTLFGKIQVRLRQLYEMVEKKTEESIQNSERLEAMISDVSHQVKTPVANLRLYHNLLERKELDETKREEFLHGAEHQVDKLEFFMSSMIRMSRLETGIVKVLPKKNSVRHLIEQAVCDAALKAEAKEIDIETACEEALEAYFDMRWTGEALFNIVDNSVKYTQRGGKVEISAAKTDFFVRIKVKDNGRGIAESRLPEIFKRFYREPESADIEGVGIGLYLAREIVMKQKGFIEVRSKAGEGTEMYLNLPIEKR